MMKWCAFVYFWICFSAAFSQAKFSILKTIPLKERVVRAAIDRVGELYLISDENRLVRIGINGETIASVELNRRPDIFDPRDGSHLFFYWREDQRFELRLPDLETISTTKTVDSAFAVSPFLVCPSGDHDVLILDSVDWSLKKVSGNNDMVLFETIIFNDGPQSTISSMREYQNFVFLHDATSGIMVFNRMGRHLKTLDAPGAAFFNFLGVELYYPSSSNKLQFFDLFTTEKRVVRLPTDFDFALLSDERLFIIEGMQLKIFAVTP